MIENIYHENIMFYYIQQAKTEIVFGKPAYIEGHNGSYKWKARRASRKKISILSSNYMSDGFSLIYIGT